jgi:hypothetical protein
MNRLPLWLFFLLCGSAFAQPLPGEELPTPYRPLTAICTVRFWCNRAQYNDALNQAHKIMLQRLHAPLLAEIAEMRTAIFDGNREEAIRICDRMKAAVGL